jgi:hypothetical protein
VTDQVGPPGTKYILLELDARLNEKDGYIHIASRDGNTLITTVNDTPGSERRHPNLYGKLNALLVANDRWHEDSRATSDLAEDARTIASCSLRTATTA